LPRQPVDLPAAVVIIAIWLGLAAMLATRLYSSAS
jgi:hypothetical protein